MMMIKCVPWNASFTKCVFKQSRDELASSSYWWLTDESLCLCVSIEYEAINSMLDEINTYLDGLEERNDSLNGKLHELMESNRQARLEFRAQLNGAKAEDQDQEEEGKEKEEAPADQERKEDACNDAGEAKLWTWGNYLTSCYCEIYKQC